jgi:hypothetical protein
MTDVHLLLQVGHHCRQPGARCLCGKSRFSYYLSIFLSPNIVIYRLSYGALKAFRTVVPIEEHRIPLTLQNAIYPVLCYTPFIFLAYLARRPDTYIIRLLWLPTVITAILVSAYRFHWAPELNAYNWGQRKL